MKTTKKILLILFLTLLASGTMYDLHNWYVKDTDNSPAAQATSPQNTTWNVYSNIKYGYEIKYPADYSLFESADQNTQKIIPAGPNSKKIYITAEAQMFFCCEPTYLAIEILDEYVDNYETRLNKITDYSNNITLRGPTNFLGEKAYSIKAECGIESPGNIVIVNHASKTYYVRYDGDECLPQAEKILSSFRFTN